MYSGNPVFNTCSTSSILLSSSDPEGGDNTISTTLIQSLTTCDIEILEKEAETGKCYIKVEWTFPGVPYPAFTTRHRLIRSKKRRVGFRGGIAWARDILETSISLGIITVPPEIQKQLSQRVSEEVRTKAESRLLPEENLLPENLPENLAAETSSVCNVWEEGTFFPLLDDRVSECSETSRRTWTTLSSAEDTYSQPPSEADPFFAKLPPQMPHTQVSGPIAYRSLLTG